MGSSYQIDLSVLTAAARVHAALELVPRISGSKEIWAPWMRDNLEGEFVSEQHSKRYKQ
jgi:hypothetical protein